VSPAVSRLLEDAQLLLSHLTYVGLVENTELATAIVGAKASLGSQDEATRVAGLRVEFSKALKQAKPLTIMKLRHADDHQYLGAFSRGLKSAKEMSISLFAVALIFFAVLGFVIVQEVSHNVAELQRISLQNPLQKLSELRRLIHEGALKDPKSAYYLQYQKAASELSLMFDSATQIMNRTAASGRGDTDIGIVGQIYEVLSYQVAGKPPAMGKAGGIGGIVTSADSDVPPGAGGHAVSAMGVAMASTVPVPTSTPASAAAIFDTSVPIIRPSDCKPYNTQQVTKLYGQGNVQFLAAALDKFDDYCLAQTLDINTGSYRPASVIYTIRALQQELFIIGVLFLPLVGGLLGSTIFIIYSVINGVSSSLIPPSYIIVRIIVGGAFGVIVGWFSSTTGNNTSDLIQHVSGTPFTLAFLAGFSIETLSLVLLRYSRAASEPQGKNRPGTP